MVTINKRLREWHHEIYRRKFLGPLPVRVEEKLDPQSEIWKKNQMVKQQFRLISGSAELTRETKITAETRLVANIFGWNTAESHF